MTGPCLWSDGRLSMSATPGHRCHMSISVAAIPLLKTHVTHVCKPHASSTSLDPRMDSSHVGASPPWKQLCKSRRYLICGQRSLKNHNYDKTTSSRRRQLTPTPLRGHHMLQRWHGHMCIPAHAPPQDASPCRATRPGQLSFTHCHIPWHALVEDPAIRQAVLQRGNNAGVVGLLSMGHIESLAP